MGMRTLRVLTIIGIMGALAGTAAAQEGWRGGQDNWRGPRSVTGIWQFRSNQGRVAGRLFLIQDGNVVRGEILDSNDRGARGDLEGWVDGRRVSLKRRFAWAGPPRQHELMLVMERGGTHLQGSINERGGMADFEADRTFPGPDAPGPGPGPGPGGPGPRGPVVVVSPPPPPAPSAVSDQRLREVMLGVNGESFDQGKMSVLRQAVVYDYYDMSQVVKILNLFSFDDPKLTALEILRPRILDPQNGLRIGELFSFDRSKEKARAILAPR
jgi:hypothetical protein